MKFLAKFILFITIISCDNNISYVNRIYDDVNYLADNKLEGRKTGSKGEQIAADYIANRFKSLKIKTKGTNAYFQDFNFNNPSNPHGQVLFDQTENDTTISSKNVIGYIDNNAEYTIVIGAHYDHLGYGGEGSLHVGSEIHNGADDNASGVAGVFETARLLVSKEHKRTLLVACWDEEERKVLGSKAYVRREKNKATNIKMSYVYEMIGYKENHKNSQQIPIGFERLYPQQVKQISDNKNRGDFIALIYDDLASSLLPMISLHAEKQGLPILQFKVGSQLKRLPVAADLRRSDHSAFWDEDYPAMMITDTANFRNQHYHCINAEDNVQSLDATFAIKTINTISKTIEDNLNR